MVKLIFSRLKSIAKTNAFLLLLFLTSSACSEIREDLPYIKNLLPKNKKGVEGLWKHYEQAFSQNAQEFLTYLNDNDGARAINLWGQNVKLTMISRTQLGYLIPVELYEGTELAQIAKHYYGQVNSLYANTVNQADFQKQVVEYVLGMHDLLPDEVQFFQDFLSRFHQGENQILVNKALAKLADFEKARFIYVEGTGQKKTFDKYLTLFNANILFMPEDFSYYFGGVSPWRERLDQIAHYLSKKNADVVCLQEVHDEESAYALFRKIKHIYPYFYINIGADVAVVNPNHIALNSGLFVASKYLINNPQFERFQVEGMQEGIHKGFFSGTLIVDNKPFCYLLSTHLNPFDNDEAKRIRENETKVIVAKIKALQQQAPLPAILVGDLNVNWGSAEWKRSLLNRAFTNAYQDKHPTCTDYFNDLVWTPPKQRDQVKKVNYIYDYALVFKTHLLNIESHMAPLYHLNKPTSALSDHQGIFSKITVEK